MKRVPDHMSELLAGIRGATQVPLCLETDPLARSSGGAGNRNSRKAQLKTGVLPRMEGSSDEGVFDSVGRRSAFHAKSPKMRWLPALEVGEKDGVVGVVGAVEL